MPTNDPERLRAALDRIANALQPAALVAGRLHRVSERIAHLGRTLPAQKRHELADDIRLAPSWMHPILRELARG
ncbi:MAG: hypothetical protein ACREEV_17975 [Dongiaceae bacterium]